MKPLIFIVCLFFTLSSFAIESYGIGKIVKVPKSQAVGFNNLQYFLVIKQADQVGAMPIVFNKSFKEKDIASKVDKIVIFRGKIKSKKFKRAERVETVEVVDFVKLKKLTFADINNNIAEINKKDPSFDLKVKPKKNTITMSDNTTQKAVLTSAALLLNDMQAAEGDQGKMRRDLTAGVLLTGGIVMMAKKLGEIIKVEKDDWDLPKNQEEKKLPLTNQD